MRLTDSHLHFDTFAEAGEVDAIIARAAQRGVTRLVAIGGTDPANELAVRLAADYPGRVYAVAGYDRDEAERDPDTDAVEALLAAPGVVGVGETGLDYHYRADTAPAQRRLFGRMLDLAAEHRLPTVIHTREADEDTLSMLTDHVAGWRGAPDRIGVLHCFTGNGAFAEKLLALGLYVSFSGIVAFKKSDDLRAVAAAVPEDRLLIETDAPYLAPPPYRGKRNEPAYVAEVAAAVADVRGVPGEELARTTTANAARLFGFADPKG
jgi:TatD DNase family protein